MMNSLMAIDEFVVVGLVIVGGPICHLLLDFDPSKSNSF